LCRRDVPRLNKLSLQSFIMLQRTASAFIYAILERARLQARKELSANAQFMRRAVTRLKPFCEVLQGSTLTGSHEGGPPLDKAAYCRDLAGVLARSIRATDTMEKRPLQHQHHLK
jgi:hypothetical protein